jgi:hypothetical protein
MATIALISCVSKKIKTKPGEKIPAGKLYTSDLFRKSLAYAKKLQADKKIDKIFILSAKHYVLPLEKDIETYNETLKNKPRGERREWNR